MGNFQYQVRLYYALIVARLASFRREIQEKPQGEVLKKIIQETAGRIEMRQVL